MMRCRPGSLTRRSSASFGRTVPCAGLTAKGKFYYSPNGAPERMLGNAVDITERKLMEVALRESEERFAVGCSSGKDVRL